MNGEEVEIIAQSGACGIIINATFGKQILPISKHLSR